jgi:hypothetical protein
MHDCNKLIDDGMIIRMMATVISLYILSLNTTYNKYTLIILPVLLTILDSFDGIPAVINKQNQCIQQYYYQIIDKMVDSTSYVLVYFYLQYFFRLDTNSNTILLIFILYRIIGVGLFYKTKDSIWLIVFFDFVKEFLLYLAVFGNNYSYIFFFIVCKIIFEYYLHTIINPNKYN